MFEHQGDGGTEDVEDTVEDMLTEVSTSCDAVAAGSEDIADMEQSDGQRSPRPSEGDASARIEQAAGAALTAVLLHGAIAAYNCRIGCRAESSG